MALANELVTYAYRNIFEKLSWLTKIVTLDAAKQLNNKQAPSMLALLKLKLLRAPFEEILETRLDIHGQHEVVQPLSFVNLMTIFAVSKENNIDIWKKVMVCFRAVYM